MLANKLTTILCTTILVVLIPAMAWGEFLGEYDHGDTVTLRAVLNDNGTAADSVSGDSIAAYVFWKTNPTDSVSLTATGTGHPWCSAFTADFIVDTADGGYGSWYAILYAVNVGAGSRDPIGLNSWTAKRDPGATSDIAGEVMDSLHTHNVPTWHIGNYQQDDSLEIYARYAGVDSVYAYTFTFTIPTTLPSRL